MFYDLIAFTAGLPQEDPVSALPLSLALAPPFTLGSLKAGAVSFAADGRDVLRLNELRLTGPTEKGLPAASLKTELDGLELASNPFAALSRCPAAGGAGPKARGGRDNPATGGPSERAVSRGCRRAFDLSLETRYGERPESLAAPEFSIALEGAFSVSGSLALEGAGRGFLKALDSTPLLRAREILLKPAFGEISVSSLKLTYSDLGLVRGILADEAGNETPGGAWQTAPETLASRLAVLALYRIDPFALNARELSGEISHFVSDPRALSLSVYAAAPVPLKSIGPGLLEPLSDVDERGSIRDAALFLAPLKASVSSGGRPAVEVMWREVPPAFMGGSGPPRPPLEALEEPVDPEGPEGAY
jgi:hypothetical protein